MKRGFEENVPKFRPRVRLGRALEEQVAEAQELAAAESGPQPSPIEDLPCPPRCAIRLGERVTF